MCAANGWNFHNITVNDFLDLLVDSDCGLDINNPILYMLTVNGSLDNIFNEPSYKSQSDVVLK